MRSLFLILPFAYCTAFAAEVSVSVVPGAAAGDCGAKGHLIATPEGRGGPVSIPLQRGTTAYPLRSTDPGPWTVRVESSDCWSETAIWTADDPASIELHVYPIAAVELGVEAPRGSKSPTAAAGKIYLQRGDLLTRLSAGTDAACAAEKGKWRCTVPAGVPFDFRFDVPRFASTHFWDLSVAANAVADLGRVQLNAGASIAGWVQDPKDKPVKNAAVSCFPMEVAAGRRDHVGARIEMVRTNARGFFQCAGLREGQHRIVINPPALSPLAISDVLVHPGESLVLPKPVRPSPFGEAEMLFEPPLDRHGKPWRVELTEAASLYPSRERRSVARTASETGRLIANGLRADLYGIEIHDSTGALMERTSIDLFGGGRHTLALSIRPILVRGTVRAGDRPLKANLELSDSRGGFLKTSSDDLGHFETSLPSAGEWKVTVLYPPQSAAARITAPPLQIPDPLPASPYDVTIQLAGGRIHGKVTGSKGESSSAAVHARSNRTTAHQLTGDDGAFDIVGLAAGTYQLGAENIAGMTAEPVEVDIEDGESREVNLVTEPTVLLSGDVVTPDGRPASGAVVRLSSNSEPRWATRVTDVHGHFEYRGSRAMTRVQAIVVTYDYPISFVTIAVREGEPNDRRIQLHSDGGLLRVLSSGETYISARGIVAPLGILSYSQYRRTDAGAYIESGSYTVCQRRGSAGSCRDVTVTPGSEFNLDLEASERGRT